MDIRLEKADTVYVEIQDIRQKIALMLCEHQNFIEIVCEILLNITKADNNISKELGTLFKLHSFEIPTTDISAYNEIKDLIIDYYLLIQDFDFESKLRSNHPKEFRNFHLEQNENKINLLRGVLFEAIVENMVIKRFGNADFCAGCYIYIDNNKVHIYYSNGRRKETFDIAGWDKVNSYGEFYECKIRPDKFMKENYELLIKLKRCLWAAGERTYKIIVAVADSLITLQQRILEIELDIENGKKINDLILYGRGNLEKINEIVIPEIA